MSARCTDSTAETLLAMERVLIAEKASVREVLQSAYRLGVIDGQLETLQAENKVARAMSQALNEGDGSYKP